MTLNKMSPLERRERNNRTNADRRAAGLCTWCAAPAFEGKTMCREHLGHVAKRERDKRARERAQVEAFVKRVRT